MALANMVFYFQNVEFGENIGMTAPVRRNNPALQDSVNPLDNAIAHTSSVSIEALSPAISMEASVPVDLATPASVTNTAPCSLSRKTSHQARPDNKTFQLLICLVCEKSSFSDISHLLTHLCSKAHLQKKFETKLESFADPKARASLDKFKVWKREHDIDRQLAQRHITKKKKPAGIQRLRDSSVVSSQSSNSRRVSVFDVHTLLYSPMFAITNPIGKKCFKRGSCQLHQSPMRSA